MVSVTRKLVASTVIDPFRFFLPDFLSADNYLLIMPPRGENWKFNTEETGSKSTESK